MTEIASLSSRNPAGDLREPSTCWVSLTARPSRHNQETVEGGGRGGLRGKGETSEMNTSRDISSDSGQGQRGKHEVEEVIKDIPGGDGPKGRPVGEGTMPCISWHQPSLGQASLRRSSSRRPRKRGVQQHLFGSTRALPGPGGLRSLRSAGATPAGQPSGPCRYSRFG